jgi:hypothetical protein
MIKTTKRELIMKIITFKMIGLLFLGGILIAQNPAGKSLILDGDGDFMELSFYADSLIFDSPATIEFWLKANIDHKIAAGRGALWSINDGSNFGSGEYFLINYGHSTQYLTDERISIIHSLQSQGMTTLYSLVDNGTYAGQWHHYAVVCDGLVYSLYVDGQISSLTPAPTFPNQTPGDYGELIIPRVSTTVGERVLGSTVDLELDGSIDELRIWKIVRDTYQIQQTWNDTLAPSYYTSHDSGLIGYWRFDEMEDLGVNNDGADDIRDLSVNGYHGDLVGDATIDTSTAFLDLEYFEKGLPSKFIFYQNYPNPFNPITTIEFDLPKTSEVTLKVFNILGEEVATIVSDRLSAGSYSYEWNAGNLASGVYLYRLQSGDYVETRKMILMK